MKRTRCEGNISNRNRYTPQEELNAIIRLSCIQGDTQVKYKRCSELRRQSGNRYQSSGEEQSSDMRLSQHMIWEHEETELHDCRSQGDKEGSDGKGEQG